MRVTVEVNGKMREADVSPGLPLLAFLRTRLGLTGTKEACGRGECGACTVLVGDTAVMSCVLLTAETRGPVTTIEGLVAASEDLREGFADEYGFQCGFCTSGQIVRAEALLRQAAVLSRADITAGMSNNICRCTGYTQIVNAVAAAARRRGQLNDGRQR